MTRLLRCLPLLLASACAPHYDHVEFELYSSPPVPVFISESEMELPVGVAAAITVRPVSSSNIEYTNEDEVVLESEDRKILRVDPTEHPRRFVLVGVSPGETCIVVEVLGAREACVPATVTAE